MKCCECNIKLCKASKYAGTTQDCTETPILFVYTICVNPHRASSVSGCVKLDPLEYIVLIVTLGNRSGHRFSSVTMYSNGDGDAAAAAQCVHFLMCIGKWWRIRMLHPTLLSLWETVAWGRGVYNYEGWYKVSQCPYKIELSISRPKDRVFSTFFHRLIYDHIAA